MFRPKTDENKYCIKMENKIIPLIDSLYKVTINAKKWKFVDCVKYSDTFIVIRTKAVGENLDFQIEIISDTGYYIKDVLFGFSKF